MGRYRVLLGLLVAVVSAWPAGCGPRARGGPDSARQQPDAPHQRCRKELILVDGRRVPNAVSPGTIEAARRFTVAVRGRRWAEDDGASESGGSDALLSEAGSPLPARVFVEGTGVVIDRAGLILTNHHVVRDTSELEVWTGRDGWRPARVIGTDPYSDLAVITVDAQLCCAAELADADALRIGQAVAALGHKPGADLADGASRLRGRVKGLHRSLQGALDPTHARYYGDLVEATVPIEPGYSGGALIDARGAVVGISTAAVTNRGTGQRIGYAIPMSAYVRSVIGRLARGRPVIHGYLGLQVCTCGADHGGVVVERLMPAGPADNAGLRTGDLIVAVASNPVRSGAHLSELVRGGPIGKPIPIQVRRGGQTVELTCTLQARPTDLHR